MCVLLAAYVQKRFVYSTAQFCAVWRLFLCYNCFSLQIAMVVKSALLLLLLLLLLFYYFAFLLILQGLYLITDYAFTIDISVSCCEWLHNFSCDCLCKSVN